MSNFRNFNQQTIISSSQSWTCPAGVNVADLILAGGGGGGYFFSDGSSFYYAAGGGGGQVKYMALCTVPGTVYVFVIGAGGTGYRNVSNVNGTATAGGSSYVYTKSNAVTTITGSIGTFGAQGGQAINLFGSTAGFIPGQIILIDSEQMIIRSIDSSTQMTAGRCYNGTSGSAHSSGASVYVLSLVAFALAGAAGSQGNGGAGGGADASNGTGATGTPTPAKNGPMNLSGGGGSQTSSAVVVTTVAGCGPGPAATGGSTIQLTTTFGSGCGGGGSWGPGGETDAPALPGTGGGGGSGRNGGSGVAALMWQAA